MTIGQSDLRRRFRRLAVVNIISNVTVPLSGLVDTAMLGHLDSIRFLGGVALGAVIFEYVYWSFGFLRMGTTGLTAQARGAGQREEHFHILHRGLLLAAGIGVVLWLLAWPLQAFAFRLFSATPEVLDAGRGYFSMRILGAPATLANFALLGWFLGREEPRRALVMTVVANLSNILFNAWFILGLGWAARGAGLSTALSQILMLVTGLLLYRKIAERPAFTVRGRLADGDWGRLLKLNGDILVRTICLVSSFALFTNWSASLGTTVLVANTILLRLQTFGAYLIDGAAFAVESLAGVLRGAGDTEGLRRLHNLALTVGVAFAFITLVLLFAAPQSILRALTSHQEVIDQARMYLPWLIPVLIFGSIAYMYDGLFLGLTEGGILRRAMLFSTFAVFLPIAWFAQRNGLNHGLWAAMAAFMLARSITLGWAARRCIITVSP